MRPLLVGLLAAAGAFGADLCPHSGDAGEWQSWEAKVGRRHCVGNAVNTADRVEWTAAGIEEASSAGHVEFAVCCFSSEVKKDALLRIGARELEVPTHQERAGGGEVEKDFPDLIEDEAHRRSVSIRGTLGDAAHPVRVDVLLRCSASKFADQYAFQFEVINRSADRVEVTWDHLRELESRVTPSVQPVAGGRAFVFLTRIKPREATATIEVKSPSGAVLARFRFDGFTLSS